MTVTVIAAVGPNGELGRGGELVYSLRDDMRHFRETTMGHPIVMGRRTFESFPKGALPGRRNIVVTRNEAYSAENIETAPSLEAAIALAGDAEVMVIGGGQIYGKAISLADRLILTEVETPAPEADTFFPKVDPSVWTLESETERTLDSRSGLPYSIRVYRRR